MSAIDTFLKVKRLRDKVTECRVTIGCLAEQLLLFETIGTSESLCDNESFINAVEEVANHISFDRTLAALKGELLERLDQNVIFAADDARNEAKQVLEILEGVVAAKKRCQIIHQPSTSGDDTRRHSDATSPTGVAGAVK